MSQDPMAPLEARMLDLAKSQEPGSIKYLILRFPLALTSGRAQEEHEGALPDMMVDQVHELVNFDDLMPNWIWESPAEVRFFGPPVTHLTNCINISKQTVAKTTT
jgi:hypothetical protein